MLQTIRNIFTGWVATIVILLLIIPFAFWGISYYFGNAANINAAEVDGVEVSLAEYQQSYQNIRRQMQNISPDLAQQDEFIKQQTLDKLVDRILLLEVKDDLGLRVSNDQVRSAIYQIPAFNNPEGFDQVTYQNYLLSSGYTPTRFENEMREDMTLEQLQGAVLATTIVTPNELKRIIAFEKQTRDIQFAKIPYASFRDKIEISEEEIQAYYNENSNDFTSPEQVKLAYIQLSVDQLAQEVEAGEDDLRTYFENFRDNYSLAERRKVKQILIYSADSEKQEAGNGNQEAAGGNEDKAAVIADQVYEQLKAGEIGFDDVKDRYDSEDITVEVSDFGFLNEGVLDPEVDKVVFSLEAGVVSEPIKTDYGYQIELVEEITGGDRPSFEQVRGEVEADYRRDQAEKRFFELYDELGTLTFEHPESLEFASDSLGLPVLESGYISRTGGGEGLLNDDKVVSAAFSDEVLLDGNNSDLIELDSDHVVVIRVLEHQEKKVLPLEDVHDTIEARLHFEKGSQMTREQGEEIIGKLKQGADPEELAGEYSIIWAERNAVARDNSELDNEIVETAFKAGRPADGTPAISGTQLIQGDYAVVLVKDVHDVSAESLADEEIAPIKNRALQNRASRSWSNIVSDLRKNADIEIFQDNL